jgi:L-ascorbate metabolism protein UlaG (beta-lactamase superfamily)
MTPGTDRKERPSVFWKKITTPILLATVCAAVASSAPEAAESATEARITFLGNEGFLIECNEKKVLIDALYRAGVPGYPVHSDEVRNQLEGGRQPFDNVNLVLATHVHNDHFDPNAVGRYPINNRDANFVSTPQAVRRLEAEFRGYSAIKERVEGTYPAASDKVPFEIDGISFEVMELHHGRGVPFQNIGFLIEIDGFKMFHMGDTQINHGEIGVHALNQEKIDVAFVPFWFLIDEVGVEMVRKAIAPAKIVPMHIPNAGAPAVLFGAPSDYNAVIQTLRAIPDVLVFEKPLESKVVSID